ncbi:MAG: acylphosphatase [Candidatus Thermoplasmatota archaeon]|nr:acylphosphatase [Candidatus Thermoplasmatota archaeon]
MKTIHVIFRGEVQGVGFRKRFAKLATHKGIRGWVKNMDNGTVEADLQGEDTAVMRCIEAAGKLSGSVRVHSAESEITDEEEYPDFRIIR